MISAERGKIGSMMCSIAVSLSTVVNSVENYAVAGSRIVDADIAQESSECLRLQILQQGAAAVLKSANAQPQIALNLLRG